MIAVLRSGRHRRPTTRADASLEGAPALVAELGVVVVGGFAAGTRGGRVRGREGVTQARREAAAHGMGHRLEPVTSPFGHGSEGIGRHGSHFTEEVSVE